MYKIDKKILLSFRFLLFCIPSFANSTITTSITVNNLTDKNMYYAIGPYGSKKLEYGIASGASSDYIPKGLDTLGINIVIGRCDHIQGKLCTVPEIGLSKPYKRYDANKVKSINILSTRQYEVICNDGSKSSCRRI